MQTATLANISILPAEAFVLTQLTRVLRADSFRGITGKADQNLSNPCRTDSGGHFCPPCEPGECSSKGD